MSLGADPHKYGVALTPLLGPRHGIQPLLRSASAFTEFLRFAVSAVLDNAYNDEEAAMLVLEAVSRMAKCCPDQDKTTLVIFRVWDTGLVTLEESVRCRQDIRNSRFFCVFLEAKLSYLMAYLFSSLKPLLDKRTTGSRIKRSFPKLEESLPKVRFIFAMESKSRIWTCERVTAQEGSKQLVDNLFAQGGSQLQTNAFIEKNTRKKKKVSGFIWSLTRRLGVVVYDVESAMLSLAAEQLNVCTCHEAGFLPPPALLRGLEHMEEWPCPRITEELMAL
ncbi:uncharacterized protein BKA55DRAFT_543436 [Fusarium redolens]|uniref:Uncharacterized protein n=1 Tax=Fusarium redolens TaxID=48865 RepID=A0A9P9JXZ0_FUSRE|nr:uncharacterized protein BKA55DRAFT_543436 [Fusarium redolens]KAH7236790.1 hypothetical protein BKA55DRAFT_543436 [Fusarium redolens]